MNENLDIFGPFDSLSTIAWYAPKDSLRAGIIILVEAMRKVDDMGMELSMYDILQALYNGIVTWQYEIEPDEEEIERWINETIQTMMDNWNNEEDSHE